MTKIRIARLAAAAVGALLVSGAVVAITAYAAGVPMPQFAASPSPSAKPQNPAAQQYLPTPSDLEAEVARLRREVDELRKGPSS